MSVYLLGHPVCCISKLFFPCVILTLCFMLCHCPILFSFLFFLLCQVGGRGRVLRRSFPLFSIFLSAFNIASSGAVQLSHLDLFLSIIPKKANFLHCQIMIYVVVITYSRCLCQISLKKLGCYYFKHGGNKIKRNVVADLTIEGIAKRKIYNPL